MRLMYDAYELPMNSLFTRMTVDKMNNLQLDTFTYITTALSQNQCMERIICEMRHARNN